MIRTVILWSREENAMNDQNEKNQVKELSQEEMRRTHGCGDRWALTDDDGWPWRPRPDGADGTCDNPRDYAPGC